MKEYKVCSKCGEKNDSGWSICNYCSTPMYEEYVEKISDTPTRKKKIKRVVIGVLIVIAMVVLGFVIYNRYEKNYQDRVFEAHLNYFGGSYVEANDLIEGLHPKRK